MRRFPDIRDNFFENFLRPFRHFTDSINTVPLREEVLSVEGLEDYASALAKEFTLYSRSRKGHSLSSALKSHSRILNSAYNVLSRTMRQGKSVSPAAEWIVDNYHVIEEQLRDIKLHLPPHFYNGLPKLSTGPFRDYPRVYAIALSFLSHTDCRLDTEALHRFIAAFQKVTPLTMGELWALSISLRLALIDFLTPIALRVLKSRANRERADELADQVLMNLQGKEANPESVVFSLAHEMGDSTNFDRALVVQLVQRLRDQDPDVWPVTEWIEKELKRNGTSSQKVIQVEHMRQAAAQVTIGNTLGSMRLLLVLDWRDFFEKVNLTDQILSQDPTGDYANMEFVTRDRYRHTIERMASNLQLNELAVAQVALDMAVEARTNASHSSSTGHIGYFLIGKGRVELEAHLRYKPRFKERMRRILLSHSEFFYFGSIGLLTAVTVYLLVAYLRPQQVSSYFLILMGSLLLIVSSEFAIGLINYCVTFFLKPSPLPKIDTRRGIPFAARTMVVVPTLFTDEVGVRELIESLHVNFIANRDDNIFYALLGDFGDEDQAQMPGDNALLDLAQRELEQLNDHYFQDEQKHFFLFARHRRWNPSEGKWIGWERKRGKLEEFNLLLRGATETSYKVVTAPLELLRTIKYVITLDSDTRLPRDSARRMVGAMIHPLNTPVADPASGRVVQGYGVLQPRVSMSLHGKSATRFVRIFAGHTGLDPYTTAVSDVYQDLFLEGSFTGKGIYDVDSFHGALKNRVPENHILSHDLFEGSFARSALLSDVEIFDDFPTSFGVYAKRLHRWTRGDWQIARWLFMTVPNAQLKTEKNILPLVCKWKIFDNMRRSLNLPALFLCFVISWLFFPGSILVWSLALFLLVFIPSYVPVTNSFLGIKKGIFWKGHFRNFKVETKNVLVQVFFTFVFLPDLAFIQLDAICRTFYRKCVSQKKLLEWTSFAKSQNQVSINSSWCKKLGVGPIVAIASALLIGTIQPASGIVACPLLLLWLFSPCFKHWLSQVPETNIKKLGSNERDSYRHIARLTWSYFEEFVNSDGNWLAPDNFQKDPLPVIAHRTSPTNIGLQLLSTCSAKDLGYIGLVGCVDILELTFKNLLQLERFQGHLFNWYNTQTREPLYPRYISTVDSGNLAGHLLATKQSCAEWIRYSPSIESIQHGLIDTLNVALFELKQSIPLIEDRFTVSLNQVQNLISQILTELKTDVKLSSNKVSRDWIDKLKHNLMRLIQAKDTVSTLVSDLPIDEHLRPCLGIKIWLERAIHQIKGILLDQEVQFDSSTRLTLESRLHQIIQTCDQLIDEMNFGFLYDKKRKTFVIGYNVQDEKKDDSYYDLLASESRLASFIAISKGDVPQEHWFHLGRPLTKVKGGRALISWTGTMFEYFMPLLVMEDQKGTLLHETYKSVLARQIEYGKKLGVPWGISEAGYNARDIHFNYQYGPFGVPGLGLKRGLSDDLVVSPYSTMLAAMLDPWKALNNLRYLEKLGMLSKYGFFESVDFTLGRTPHKQKYFVLQSFMAHHQGMSLVAINNILNENVMQRRFHADPLVISSELLLQEKIPYEAQISKPREEEVLLSHYNTHHTSSLPRVFSGSDLSRPQTQLLSNGTYSVMVGANGSGYSKCGELAVNRWREDVTQDNWGQYIYIRNRSAQHLWSAGFLPTGTEATEYRATFSEDRVDIRRTDKNIDTHTEIIVSPEDNVELRRVSLTNHSLQTIEIEVTSYFEAVFAPHLDDLAHPAFSNLFVETEFVPNLNALLATRRKRSDKDSDVCGFHLVFEEGVDHCVVQYETDRSRFLGRGRTSINPLVINEQLPLSNTTGSVLDPIFSLRRVLKIKPGVTSRLCFVTGVTNSRDEALQLCDKYHDSHIFCREAELAWTQAQVHLRHLSISSRKANYYQALASHLVFSNSSLRPRSFELKQNNKSQAGLWTYGISGDIPIALTSISDEKDMLMVRELLHAHEYLRLKGLVFDLVILNETTPSYFQSLQDELYKQIRICGSKALLNKSGGVFLRRADSLSEADLLLLRSSARVVLLASKGTLAEQLDRVSAPSISTPSLVPRYQPEFLEFRNPTELSLPELSFYNGIGGFASSGKEYCIILKEQQWTPAPWINVVANKKDFGFIISESGSGYTWSQNSRENRLTPWSNDAVSDPAAECVYIRDEDTGEFWTPTPLPIRNKEAYLISHTQGSTQFEHIHGGLHVKLEVFVAPEDSVKITRVKIKNLDRKKRNLTLTSYVEWVLGFSRGSSAPYVVTEIDPKTQAILARNPYNNEFSKRIAFHQISETERSYTCDRNEFIGSNGSLAFPAALERSSLASSSGAGIDPCGVLQHKFLLGTGESKEFYLLLGQGESIEEVDAILQKFLTVESVEAAFQASAEFWENLLAGLKVYTPDESMNILVNNWLLYQTLSCRMWARSAFYQSGGAYGFRDQLQDVMALVYNAPDISREHILRASSRQFPEGDVQHWWHPPAGRGVRTRFSDDLLWLPYVASFYANSTGDSSIFDELTSFVEAPLLTENMDDSYTLPLISKEKASLLEHCARAIDRSLKVGVHGLPLMGSGDWNDGMNQVGPKGHGESVWVAWFLHATIKALLPFLERSGSHTARIEKYKQHLVDLRSAVESKAWDGCWYLRAYFDDGTPLGSSMNDECRIDSIAQSWAVLSGASSSMRAKRAMASVDELLVDRGDGLIKLLAPPFDKSQLNPGYIKGYVPGVRENGGQYTHAAIWTLMAFAKLGDGDKAAELFALLSPINHSSTHAGLHRYKVEPYVVSADIYGLSPHVGRGGWTWYTGSASLMFRAAIESILGFELRGDTLHFHPQVPSGWNGFRVEYRWKSSLYKISFRRHPELPSSEQTIELKDTGQIHEVEIFFN